MLGQRFLASLPHPDHHSEAWQYLARQQQPYPAGVDIAPYRRPRKPERKTPLTSLRLTRYGKQAKATERGYVLELFDERGQQLHLLPDGAGQAQQLKEALFTQANRGRMLVLANERGEELRDFWDRFALPLAELGYVLEPVGHVHRLIGVRVKRSRQLWRLCDVTQVTGVTLKALRRQNRVLGRAKGTYAVPIARLWHTLTWLQNELWQRFGVSFHETIGNSAVKAASYHLPAGAWVWRPNPLILAMLRAGGGYRGGQVRSQRYKGPAWRIDVRRMYTAMLAKPLPLRVSFGPWHGPEQQDGGVYMCTLSGVGQRPVYVSRWNASDGEFQPVLLQRGPAVCILTTDEMVALGKLGFTVLAGYGFGFWRTFTLSGYVDKLQRLTRQHGANSAIGAMCKALGNHVYGKWAQSPHRWDIAFSLERPGDDYLPFCDERGSEIEHLWTRYVTRFRYTQHLELAAVVAAHARAELWSKLAQLLADGYDPVKENTDCIWIRGQPPPAPAGDGETFGTWRLEGYDERAILLPTGAYWFAGAIRRPGGRRFDFVELEAEYEKAAAGEPATADPSDALPLAG